jgi:hypothetical protein
MATHGNTLNAFALAARQGRTREIVTVSIPAEGDLFNNLTDFVKRGYRLGWSGVTTKSEDLLRMHQFKHRPVADCESPVSFRISLAPSRR